MSWWGVTDEWVEERVRGKHYCNTVWTLRDPCTPTHALPRTHTHTHIYIKLLSFSLCLRADLIMVTPILERWWQHGGGCSHLWVRWAVRVLTHISSPRQFQSAVPVSQCAALTKDWRCRHSATAELPSQPNKWPKLTKPIFFWTTYPLLMWIHAATKAMTNSMWKFDTIHGSL